MPAWLKLVGELLAPLLNVLLGALRTRRLDEERDAANRDAATSQAEAQTEGAIAEIADAQKQISVGGSATDIARRLRERAAKQAGPEIRN